MNHPKIIQGTHIFLTIHTHTFDFSNLWIFVFGIYVSKQRLLLVTFCCHCAEILYCFTQLRVTGLPLFDIQLAIRFVSYSGTNYSELFGCNRADTFKSNICTVLML